MGRNVRGEFPSADVTCDRTFVPAIDEWIDEWMDVWIGAGIDVSIDA